VTCTSQPRDFIRHFLDTYERCDLEAFCMSYATDCTFPVLECFGVDPGWENYQVFMTKFIDAFRDISHTIAKLPTDDDNIWARYTMTGTHRGPLRGVEPTGRRVRYPIVAMYRVSDGLITDADFVSDVSA